MKTTSKYLIAFVVCFVVFLLYSALGVLLGWKHGGGVFPMILLIGLITMIWKSIVGAKDKKIKNIIPQEQIIKK